MSLLTAAATAETAEAGELDGERSVPPPFPSLPFPHEWLHSSRGRVALHES